MERSTTKYNSSENEEKMGNVARHSISYRTSMEAKYQDLKDYLSYFFIQVKTRVILLTQESLSQKRCYLDSLIKSCVIKLFTQSTLRVETTDGYGG